MSRREEVQVSHNRAAADMDAGLRKTPSYRAPGTQSGAVNHPTGWPWQLRIARVQAAVSGGIGEH
jgi:hypothetical protein